MLEWYIMEREASGGGGVEELKARGVSAGHRANGFFPSQVVCLVKLLSTSSTSALMLHFSL